MLGIFEVFKKHHVNVISIVPPSLMVEVKRIAAIRIRTEEYKSVAKELEKAAFPVLSMDKWPSI